MLDTVQETIRILIVEDDLRVARIVRDFVGRLEGFAVVGSAASAMAAYSLVQRTQPHLVVLDVWLPDGLGTDLLRRLRSTAAPVDVLLLTAAREVAVLQEALRSGVIGYLVKPFTFERFAATLSAYRLYRQQLAGGAEVEQSLVDRLLQTLIRGQLSQADKGIDPLTLERVHRLLQSPPRPVTAEEMGRRAGVSRTTARRYLEHLAQQGKVGVELVYGTVGRPERRYRLLGS